jgi:flagellar protein FlaG
MDIAQIKSPQAQQDVGPKVVKVDFGSSPTEKSEGVADKVAQQQAEVASSLKNQAQESREQMTQKLEKQVNKMNEYVQSIQRDLQFSVDDDSGEVVVRVFNTSTNELVRQFPSEEALALAQRMKESVDNKSGLLLKVEV